MRLGGWLEEGGDEDKMLTSEEGFIETMGDGRPERNKVGCDPNAARCISVFSASPRPFFEHSQSPMTSRVPADLPFLGNSLAEFTCLPRPRQRQLRPPTARERARGALERSSVVPPLFPTAS